MIFLIAKLVEFRKDMTKIKYSGMKALFQVTKTHGYICQFPNVYRYYISQTIEMLKIDKQQ